MASTRATALARPLPRGDRSVSASAFAFLFAELISYVQARITTMADLEARLESAGAGVGARFLELAAFRDKPGRRETSVVGMLQFVSGAAWQSLFGKHADALEKSTEVAAQYMIREDEPLTNHFISMPKEYSRCVGRASPQSSPRRRRRVAQLDSDPHPRALVTARSSSPTRQRQCRELHRGHHSRYDGGGVLPVYGHGRHGRRTRKTPRQHRFPR